MKKYKKFFIQLFHSWDKDQAFTHGAALSFYTITALPAFLLIIFFLANFFVDKQTISTHIIHSFSLVFTEKALDVIAQILQSLPEEQHLSFGLFLSAVFFLTTASGIFGQIQSSLNQIWNVESKEKKSWKKFFFNQAILFLMFFFLGLLFIFSLIFESVFSLGSHFLSQFVSLPFQMIHLFTAVFNFFTLVFIVTLLFQFLPHAKISLKDSVYGALFTATLFTLGKFLLSIYFARMQVGSGYGATGSIILLLLWIYYSSQVFFLGAEFTKNFSNSFGSKIKIRK